MVSTDANPFRYCGEYFDKETDTYYLRARYYNPKTGRFMSEDPAGDGLNWYTYCAGNPVMFIDPSGLAIYYVYDESDEYARAAAKTYTKQLKADYGEDEVKEIPVKNLQKLYDAWAELKITLDDTLIVNCHGNIDEDKIGYIDIDKKQVDISKLSDKEIGTVIMLACNAGQFNGVESNVICQLYERNTIDVITGSAGELKLDAYKKNWPFNNQGKVRTDGAGMYALVRTEQGGKYGKIGKNFNTIKALKDKAEETAKQWKKTYSKP